MPLRMPPCRARGCRSAARDRRGRRSTGGSSARSGTNEAAPSIVVLLDSARSAEPPHSSAITPATALIPRREASGSPPLWGRLEHRERVGGPSGTARGCSRSKLDALRIGGGPGVEAAPATAACSSSPRATALRVCSMTSCAPRRSARGRSRGPPWWRPPRPRRAPSRGSCRCSACWGGPADDGPAATMKRRPVGHRLGTRRAGYSSGTSSS